MRTTAAAVIVVGVALALASVLMVVLLRRSLTEDVRSAALLRAETVADGIAAGPDDSRIDVRNQEEEFVQVIDSDGTVVASSENLFGDPVVTDMAPGETTRVDGLPFEDETFLVVARGALTNEGPLTVIVGRSLERVTESSQAVVGLLAAGVPLLLVFVAGVTWAVVGRALSPVEAMRSEVEAISTDELHRRVPDPGGRDEIARLATTMNRMLARLESGHKRQRRFVSDASHELRSPVATIRQHAEVALSYPESAKATELGGVVLEEAERLARIVDDLLHLSQMDEGKLPLHIQPVDLDDLVFEEAERLRGTSDRRVDTSGVSAGRVAGDRRQLGKLIRNLTDNAVRHGRSAVALALSEEDSAVILTVDDDGRGIPPAERERVFERFVRLDEARARDSGGSGLGLAIVSQIAAAHGATASASESPLGGARFEVRFPRSAGPQV